MGIIFFETPNLLKRAFLARGKGYIKMEKSYIDDQNTAKQRT